MGMRMKSWPEGDGRINRKVVSHSAALNNIGSLLDYFKSVDPLLSNKLVSRCVQDNIQKPAIAAAI